MHAFAGADTIEVGDLGGTDLATVELGLGLFDGSTDGQPDTVVLNGTENRDVVEVARSASDVVVAGLPPLVRIVGGEAANDTLRIQTLAGDDEVTVAPDVNDLITTIVDLGADE